MFCPVAISSSKPRTGTQLAVFTLRCCRPSAGSVSRLTGHISGPSSIHSTIQNSRSYRPELASRGLRQPCEAIPSRMHTVSKPSGCSCQPVQSAWSCEMAGGRLKCAVCLWDVHGGRGRSRSRRKGEGQALEGGDWLTKRGHSHTGQSPFSMIRQARRAREERGRAAERACKGGRKLGLPGYTSTGWDTQLCALPAAVSPPPSHRHRCRLRRTGRYRRLPSTGSRSTMLWVVWAV